MSLESPVGTKLELLVNFLIFSKLKSRFGWAVRSPFTKATSSACESLTDRADGRDKGPKRSMVLPWARRTRVGRRNLLTTASSGSANGLQVISDRLADNFSILPGHHGTGDEGDRDDGGGGCCGGNSDGEIGDEDEGDGGCVMMSKSFAMFECGNEGSAQPLSVRSAGGWEGGREVARSFLALSISVCPPTPTEATHTPRTNSDTV